MRRTTLAAAAVAALSLAATPSLGSAVTVSDPNHLSSSHITEDDPRWDCATMGNKACSFREFRQERCHKWPGATTLVPRWVIGKRVDTVVGHDTFRVGPCDGWTQMKGSSFVIHVGHGGKKDGWVSIT